MEGSKLVPGVSVEDRACLQECTYLLSRTWGVISSDLGAGGGGHLLAVPYLGSYIIRLGGRGGGGGAGGGHLLAVPYLGSYIIRLGGRGGTYLLSRTWGVISSDLGAGGHLLAVPYLGSYIIRLGGRGGRGGHLLAVPYLGSNVIRLGGRGGAGGGRGIVSCYTIHI